MEVRCASCTKLFRVSDDKITGTGIKFGCTRCGQTVTITRENLEQHLLSTQAASVLASFEPKPAKTKRPDISPELQQISEPAKSPDFDVFDLSDPAEAAAALQSKPLDLDAFDLSDPAAAAAAQSNDNANSFFSEPDSVLSSEPEMPVFMEPEPKVESFTEAKAHKAEPAELPKIEIKPVISEPVLPPKVEIKAPPKPETVRPPVSPAAPIAPREAVRPSIAPVAAAQQTAASAGYGKKIVFVLMFLLIIGAAAYGVMWYLGNASQQVVDAAKQLTSPDGLQILNAAGTIDPGNGDLIITGVIENSTDNPKPAWYVLAEIYDAHSSILIKAKSLSGKQVYTRRDFEIMLKRGDNIEAIKTRSIQEHGIIIPAKGSANFEIRIMEPPVGIASFNATLQPFDPVQLFKEMAEEQKQ